MVVILLLIIINFFAVIPCSFSMEQEQSSEPVEVVLRDEQFESWKDMFEVVLKSAHSDSKTLDKEKFEKILSLVESESETLYYIYNREFTGKKLLEHEVSRSSHRYTLFHSLYEKLLRIAKDPSRGEDLATWYKSVNLDNPQHSFDHFFNALVSLDAELRNAKKLQFEQKIKDLNEALARWLPEEGSRFGSSRIPRGAGSASGVRVEQDQNKNIFVKIDAQPGIVTQIDVNAQQGSKVIQKTHAAEGSRVGIIALEEKEADIRVNFVSKNEQKFDEAQALQCYKNKKQKERFSFAPLARYLESIPLSWKVTFVGAGLVAFSVLQWLS